MIQPFSRGRGNYAMSAILKGARREEEAASAQGSKK
jgi:hypothetical protein